MLFLGEVHQNYPVRRRAKEEEVTKITKIKACPPSGLRPRAHARMYPPWDKDPKSLSPLGPPVRAHARPYPPWDKDSNKLFWWMKRKKKKICGRSHNIKRG